MFSGHKYVYNHISHSGFMFVAKSIIIVLK